MLSLLLAGCGGATVTTTTPTAPPTPSAEGRVWPEEGPFKWAPRATEPAITANDLRTRLYQISNDSMLGRRIGEPSNYKVTAYITSEFQRLGLKPAGENQQRHEQWQTIEHARQQRHVRQRDERAIELIDLAAGDRGAGAAPGRHHGQGARPHDVVIPAHVKRGERRARSDRPELLARA